MITDVSLRLLYLIFDRLLRWLALLGSAASSKDRVSTTTVRRGRRAGLQEPEGPLALLAPV
jgi:hypothetical protein